MRENGYNKRYNVEIFEVGDIISVGISRKDRAKTVDLLRSHIQIVISCYQNMAF